MPTPPLIEHFAVLKDPRIDRTKQHLLLAIVAIVVIAFCAVLCGAEGWEDMETFGHAKKEWLQERLGLELPHGVPGDDTFRRLFARLDPEEFGRCFLSFAQLSPRVCTRTPRGRSLPSTARRSATPSMWRLARPPSIWCPPGPPGAASRSAR